MSQKRYPSTEYHGTYVHNRRSCTYDKLNSTHHENSSWSPGNLIQQKVAIWRVFGNHTQRMESISCQGVITHTIMNTRELFM